MTTSYISPAFSSGELSPELFGRVDLEAFHRAASTIRNMFVNYKGGVASRAGTAFVGRCKQTGSTPPRDIKFQYSVTESYALEFGTGYMRVKTNGGYVTESVNHVSAVSNALPAHVTLIHSADGFSNNDWIFLSGINGMPEIDEQTFIVTNVTDSGRQFDLLDLFGNPLDTRSYGAYTGGGGASRIFTLATPYDAIDLQLIKYTQSKNTMTLVHPRHPPYDLVRNAPDDWTLTEIDFGSSIAAPVVLSVVPSTTTTSNPTTYSYVVTAVDRDNGDESIASNIGSTNTSVDISTTLGSIRITWSPVANASSYNIYKAPITINGTVPAGAIFGYVGTALGLEFVDNNIIQDFTVSPPLHTNPFADRPILDIDVTAGGSGYTSDPSITINHAVLDPAVLQAIIVNGALAGVLIQNGGAKYLANNQVVISGGGGTGATATIGAIGPSTGIYPSVVAYFQERRVYASTLNNPDTYYMSKPGSFDNMDVGAIPITSDAVVGTPWAQQVNGINWLIPMPGGLVVLTGLGAWQITGAGGAFSPIGPNSQNAVPQAYNGANIQVQPVVVNNDILYVQTKGSIVRDLAYSFLTNIYTGTDISVLSSHLFDNRTIQQWAYAEEPFKTVWAIRDDGILLTLTYLKEQNIQGWTHCDTQGFVVSVCSVSEPPIDTIYLIVRRFVNGAWWYFSERMDDRLWDSVEDCWCVDSGLKYPQPEPNATIQALSLTGTHGIRSVDLMLGGSGYTNPGIEVIDPTGSGADLSAVVVGGIITGINIDSPGEGYSSPKIRFVDSTGLGAVANATIDERVTINADAAVFTSANIGDVIRYGNGIGTITDFISNVSVKVSLIAEITAVIPDDPDETPAPAAPGQWTMTTPTTVVYGLRHLNGKTVVGLADGSVVGDLIVEDGQVTLPYAASSIVLGLSFTPQFQTLYLDVPGEATVQGKRKNISAVTVRFAQTRGVSVGSNQPDASVQPNRLPIPWTGLKEIKARGADVNAGNAIPLYTGDKRITISGEYRKPGQVAIQQDYPLPMNILAVIPEVLIGDDNG